jgi:ABC-type lipoprotein release transport system permease subunit
VPAARVTFASAIGLTLLMTFAGTLLPALRPLRIDSIRAIRMELVASWRTE